MPDLSHKAEAGLGGALVQIMLHAKRHSILKCLFVAVNGRFAPAIYCPKQAASTL
jgi:hypothetical protein